MLAQLKNRLRTMRNEGRHVALIDAAAQANYRAKNARDRVLMAPTIRALGRVGSQSEELLDFAFGSPQGIIAPMQDRFELGQLMQRVAQLHPQTVLEVGTARGGTLLLLCRHAAPDALVVSVDLPYGRNGGGYPRWKASMYERFAHHAQRLVLIRGDSHAESTRDTVERVLNRKPLDFLLIDGDHSYEGVKRDFELYSPLVAPTGLIALHDILENRHDPEIDVHRFWQELRQTHRTEEILAPGNPGVFGIGLVTPQPSAAG